MGDRSGKEGEGAEEKGGWRGREDKGRDEEGEGREGGTPEMCETQGPQVCPLSIVLLCVRAFLFFMV